MDAKAELPIRVETPRISIKGRDRFSTHTFLRNLELAAGDRQFLLRLFGSIGLWAIVTNPLNIPDPTPYWKNLMFGTKAEAAEMMGSTSNLDRKYPELVKIAPPQINNSVTNTTKDEIIPPHLETFAKDPVRIKNTLRWRGLIEQVVADERLGIKPEDRASWVNHMLKLIFIESEGNPQASSGIAFGLTQLKKSTADELAGNYEIKNYKLDNPWDNAFLGTAHQLRMSRIYGGELAGWVHHLGAGNMNEALRAYFISVLKLPIYKVEALFATPEGSELLLKYIKGYQITPGTLLKNPAVTAKLKQIGAWGDQTWEYDERYKAAGISLQVLG